jgi:hypothetical protein
MTLALVVVFWFIVTAGILASFVGPLAGIAGASVIFVLALAAKNK